MITQIVPCKMFRVTIDGTTKFLSEAAMRQLRAQIDTQLMSSGGSLRQAVLDIVALHFDVSVPDLLGRRRFERVTWPRHVAMHLLRAMTQDSLSAIGEYMGGRDHGTIHHGDRSVRERLQTSAQARIDLDLIKNRIALTLEESKQPKELAA